MYKLGKKSRLRLKGVHPDLISLAEEVLQICPYDFVITEGVRDYARQKMLVKQGASKTLKSKHLVQPDGFGHAYDLMAIGDLDKNGVNDAKDLSRTWDRDIYTMIAKAHKMAAKKLGIDIRCGALDFGGWFDGPHIELVKKP